MTGATTAVLQSLLPRLEAFAHSLAGRDADDVVQETMARALERRLEGDPERIRAYLFQIAANLCRDRHRRRKREAEVFAEMAEREAAPAGMTEERAAVWRAVRRLPAVQREVFLLRHEAGLKFAEIADLLGVPLNTALGRMHDAMEKLRKELAVEPV